MTSDQRTGSCAFVGWLGAVVIASITPWAASVTPIDPDAGIVIDWKNLERIAAGYNATPEEEWLPPPSPNCSCVKLQYRALYCPWYLKPFRDPFDLVVTETKKWPVSRKLLGCEKDENDLNGPDHTGLPMMAYFGTECCRVYANSTQAYEALSAFDSCWAAKNELETCFSTGHGIAREHTALTPAQYAALVRNATYADAATPHLAASLRAGVEAPPRSQAELPSVQLI
eukprot:gnl/TRDRNA2_/TRDRNA2_201831_c0_seq1.p1 gnl/TRDRNA2_/TRDRNA2_201831_c0~~gnl/TRDRNA2_/TRDRNA2_201831_c0_seq1.p1  ORF type:complete len:228 (+),score=20.84 gnl/TRDRNA2_/TRDRNA2_201831_c0_seq1:108-791(+)